MMAITTRSSISVNAFRRPRSLRKNRLFIPSPFRATSLGRPGLPQQSPTPLLRTGPAECEHLVKPKSPTTSIRSSTRTSDRSSTLTQSSARTAPKGHSTGGPRSFLSFRSRTLSDALDSRASRATFRNEAFPPEKPGGTLSLPPRMDSSGNGCAFAHLRAVCIRCHARRARRARSCPVVPCHALSCPCIRRPDRVERPLWSGARAEPPSGEAASSPAGDRGVRGRSGDDSGASSRFDRF